MATRKKAAKATASANEAAWVREFERAPEGKPFCDVAYEHRLHKEPLTVLGVEFVPGQITTYRTRADVPDAMVAHPELRLNDTMFGGCRVDPMYRYTPFTEATFPGEPEEPEPEPAPEPEPEGE